MVLTDGDLDEIGEKVQDVIAQSWRKIENCYGALLTRVEQSITELKLLTQEFKEPTQLTQGLQLERITERTFGMRIVHIPTRDLQFDFVEAKQHAKNWDHVNMNMAALVISDVT